MQGMHGALPRCIMRSLLLSSLLLAACDPSLMETGGAADLNGPDAKADGLPGIEVFSRIVPGSTDAVLTAALPRLGYVFFAAEGAKVTLEVTHGGSDNGLDTQLKLYGPRLADGTYPKTLASDDDSGYGKLSKIGNIEIAIGGFYLAELTTPTDATPNHTSRGRRI